MLVFDLPRLVQTARYRAADGHGQEDTGFDSRVLLRFNEGVAPDEAAALVGSRGGLARSHAQRQVQCLRCAALPQLTQDDARVPARAVEGVLRVRATR